MKIRLETNRKEAATKIKAAYDAGLLTAQLPKPKMSYHATHPTTGVVHRCAIGQLFTEQEADQLERGLTYYCSAVDLLQKGMLVVPVTDAEWFVEIQTAHDALGSSKYQDCPDETARYEKRFLELLA